MGFLIDMVAVGYGDAFLLTIDDPKMSAGESYVLVDGGPGGDDGTERLAQHIRDHAGGHLDLVICSHADSDHISGLVRLVAEYEIPVTQLAVNVPPGLETEGELRKCAADLRGLADDVDVEASVAKSVDNLADLVACFDDGDVVPAVAGCRWSFGDTTLDVLSPTKGLLDDWYAELIKSLTAEAGAVTKAIRGDRILAMAELIAARPTTAVNNASVVFQMIDKEGPYALFPGDAGAEVIADSIGSACYGFLKVPHHGSETGMTDDLAERFEGGTAYVPVGANRHGHPSHNVLDALAANDMTVICSEKTEGCSDDCKRSWGSIICHKHLRLGRSGWTSINPGECPFNK